jgi:hypothetical protein
MSIVRIESTICVALAVGAKVDFWGLSYRTLLRRIVNTTGQLPYLKSLDASRGHMMHSCQPVRKSTRGAQKG